MRTPKLTEKYNVILLIHLLFVEAVHDPAVNPHAEGCCSLVHEQCLVTKSVWANKIKLSNFVIVAVGCCAGDKITFVLAHPTVMRCSEK